MSSRLRDIAEENHRIAADGRYTAADGTSVLIGGLLSAAVEGTVCHRPDQPLSAAAGPAAVSTRFTVTAEGSLHAARRLCAEGGGEVAVLNFASARNPGGGYLRGARAQEEDLCRESLLYDTLIHAPEYYEAHRASRDLLYSSRVIWSPRVPVHRGDDGALLAEPHRVSFLTCPAPNATQLRLRDPDAEPGVRAVLRERAGRVLAVAAHHGVRRLVLGAWGCGVFGNDPAAVAAAFQHWLCGEGGFARTFDEVVFAVWDRAEPSRNREAFLRQFAA